MNVTIKAMTHQPTQLLSRDGSGPVGVCVIGLQLDSFLHSSLISDDLVRSRPPYDSTVELGWLMCHGLQTPKDIKDDIFSLLKKKHSQGATSFLGRDKKCES